MLTGKRGLQVKKVYGKASSACAQKVAFSARIS